MIVTGEELPVKLEAKEYEHIALETLIEIARDNRADLGPVDNAMRYNAAVALLEYLAKKDSSSAQEGRT